MEEAEVLLLESFYCGAYKQLMDFLNLLPRTCLYTLPSDASKQFRWTTLSREKGKADLGTRTSALVFAELVQESPSLKTLFTSSILNLCELIALRPDLGKLRKIIYFHENQVIHPVHHRRDRDFQHGYSEILSCLAADVVVFNSQHHMNRFLNCINTFLNAMPPDNHPKNIAAKIKPKCRVLFFPIEFYQMDTSDSASVTPSTSHLSPDSGSCRGLNVGSSSCGTMDSKTTTTSPKLHIVWPYRWEQDKNPDLFFKTLSKMKSQRAFFQVTILGDGDQSTQKPETYDTALKDLDEEIEVWGYQRTEEDYHRVLQSADIVVSTAKEEFCGASVLEAVHAGCTPLCPNQVLGGKEPSVYTEILPENYHDTCLWKTKEHLYRLMKGFVENYKLGKFTKGIEMNPQERFSWDVLRSEYENLLFGGSTDL